MKDKREADDGQHLKMIVRPKGMFGSAKEMDVMESRTLFESFKVRPQTLNITASCKPEIMAK